MLSALGYGLLAASSLVVGAGLALGAPVAAARGRPRAGLRRRRADQRGQLRAGRRGARGGQHGFGGGRAGGRSPDLLRAGRRGLRARPGAASGRMQSSDPGTSLALGALLDGIPEQLVLGLGLAAGEGVGVGLLVAIYVSNLPEGIGSAADMRSAGRSSRVDRLAVGPGGAGVHGGHRGRLRAGRRDRGRVPGGDRRLRGRRAAGDAGGLDGPRGAQGRRPRGRPGHGAGLRGGDRAVVG